ncbi:Sas10/Utp3/C1D family, partial [Teratosphaeria destructans]
MAAETALPDVLSSLRSATDAAISGLPEASSLLPPDHGITLLDAKNDVFLAYLQALALRNLHVIRGIKDGSDAPGLDEALTKKLVEHRVYLERGVRPLEQKIKYQVDKVVKAADDEERATAHKAASNRVANGRVEEGAGQEDEEGSDEDDVDSDEEAAAMAHARTPLPSPALPQTPPTLTGAPRAGQTA